MKISLTLTGSSAAIAAAMQAFESIEGDSGNASSTSTGAGTPAPMPPLSAPSSAAPTPPVPTANTGSDDEADEGDDTDGSGLDSAGLPWDERIHSGSKKRGQDGTWNSRRGGPKGAEREAIEAELRAGGQTTEAPAAPQPLTPVPPMPTAETAPQPPQPAPLAPITAMPPPLPSGATEAPAPVPMPAALPPMPTPEPTPQPEPAAEQPAAMDFATFMQSVGPKMGEGEGQISAAYLQQVNTHYGLGSLTDLSLKPEMIPQIVAQFQADGKF